jgi:hypothetical protein
MKRYLIPMVVVLAVLAAAWPTFGQREGQPAERRAAEREDWPMFQMLSPEEAAKLKEKWPNMSEDERANFRAEMRQRWQNLSEEEKEKLKAGMRERFGAGRLGPGMGREEQLQAVKAIEEQVAKLKAAIETGITPEALQKLRDAPAEDSAKIREKLMKARQSRQDAIAAIEAQIAKLKGEGAPIGPPPGVLLGELQAIRKMAVEEKAQETAKRLERLIGKYQTELRVRPREAQQEPPRPERPRGDRPEKTRQGGER